MQTLPPLTTPQLAKKQPFYRPELDALRFLAFFAVFLFHTVDYPADYFIQHHVPRLLAQLLSSLTASGQYGVNLFFALSSYLITDLLMREREQCGSLDVRFFYLRRILRIWPLYYFIVILTLVVPLFDPNHVFGLKYVLPFMLLSGNWAFVVFGWLPSVAASPLWSVSVEEQFYLFWPPVVARLSRKQIIYSAVAMILVANFTRIAVLLTGGTPSSLWPNTFAHLDSIAAGILLSVLLRGQVPAIGFPTRTVLLLIGATCVMVRGYFQRQSGEMTGGPLSWGTTILGWPVVAISCAIILYSFIGLKIKQPRLQYLGKISYGLYAYHMFCIMIIDYLLTIQHRVAAHTFLHVILRFIFSLGLTVSVSAISYAILEKPFLKLKEKFTHIRSRPV